MKKRGHILISVVLLLNHLAVQGQEHWETANSAFLNADFSRCIEACSDDADDFPNARVTQRQSLEKKCKEYDNLKKEAEKDSTNKEYDKGILKLVSCQF